MNDLMENENNYAAQYDFTSFKKNYMIADQGFHFEIKLILTFRIKCCYWKNTM